MARKFFKRYMPRRERALRSPLLRVFGRVLHQPNLWHLNRRSVSRAAVVGLFWTVIPMPFQMIPGAACAVAVRANLGISLLLIWLTNPLTLPPVLWVNYHFGRMLLRQPRSELDFEWSWQSISAHLSEIWRPMYVGAITCGVLLAMAGYIGVQVIWRWSVTSRWRARRGD